MKDLLGSLPLGKVSDSKPKPCDQTFKLFITRTNGDELSMQNLFDLIYLKLFSKQPVIIKGAVHILGEICPRSNPDIAHMGYYLDPTRGPHQGARF